MKSFDDVHQVGLQRTVYYIIKSLLRANFVFCTLVTVVTPWSDRSVPLSKRR